VTIVDAATLSEVGRSEPIDDLSAVAISTSGDHLYGVSGLAVGLVHAWRVVGESLVLLGEPVRSGGSEPCHLVVHPDGYLIVANYGNSEAGSVAALPIAADGSLGAPTTLSREIVPGPDPDRQAESHIHQVVLGDGSEVLVVDLGADEVVSYLFTYGGLVDPVVSRAPSGAGPRHLVQLPGGDIAVSGELSSTLLLARRVDRRFVDWSATPATRAQPADDVRNYPSDIRMGPEPDVVYLANRGVNSVAALSVSTGEVLREGPCGAVPRQLAVDGELIYVAATDSDEVNVLLARTLQAARPPIQVARPMCVVVSQPSAAGASA
jgi:6-phosphogluconolactonase (cycloisomerase 2 family)